MLLILVLRIDCSSDVEWFYGLYSQYQRIDTTCSLSGNEDITEQTSDVTCDTLTDSQCNDLEAARGNANAALTFSVLIVITYICILSCGKRTSGVAMFVMVGIAAVLGLLLLSTAFGAVSSFQELMG